VGGARRSLAAIVVYSVLHLRTPLSPSLALSPPAPTLLHLPLFLASMAGGPKRKATSSLPRRHSRAPRMKVSTRQLLQDYAMLSANDTQAQHAAQAAADAQGLSAAHEEAHVPPPPPSAAGVVAAAPSASAAAASAAAAAAAASAQVQQSTIGNAEVVQSAALSPFDVATPAQTQMRARDEAEAHAVFLANAAVYQPGSVPLGPLTSVLPSCDGHVSGVGASAFETQELDEISPVQLSTPAMLAPRASRPPTSIYNLHEMVPMVGTGAIGDSTTGYNVAGAAPGNGDSLAMVSHHSLAAGTPSAADLPPPPTPRATTTAPASCSTADAPFLFPSPSIEAAPRASHC